MKTRKHGAGGPEDLLRRGTDDHYRDAALYDFEYEDRIEDIHWYRRVTRRYGDSLRILELGAGTGRITRPLVEDGHFVFALDRMPTMLEPLQESLHADGHEERVAIVSADMRDIPLADASVQLVIAPFNALMHLYRWQDLLATFREAFRVLEPGGAFVFDVQLPDLDWLLWPSHKRHAITRFTHPQTGERLVYSTNHTYDPATQVCHIRIYYDEAPRTGRRFLPPPEPKRLVHLAHRQIFPEELRAYLGVAGFELVRHDGDFDDTPLHAEHESQCVIAHKPSAS